MQSGQPELVRPMEPIRVKQPFDDPRFVFQLKWDGIRLLALHRGPGDTRLYTKQLRDRTAQYPEVVAAVQAVCGDRPALLDGEAVLYRDGRPWFPDVLRRASLGPAAAATAARERPVQYAVFDVLHWDGETLLSAPLEQRTELVAANVKGPGLVAVDSVRGKGTALFQLVEAQRWEGIVAKRAGSPYVPGGKSPLWQKCKRSMRHLFAVIGCTWRGQQAASLLLGGYRDGVLLYCGRAGTGLTAAEWGQIGAYCRAAPPLRAPGPWPRRLDGAEALWVEPQLTVWIEFLEWTEALQVRHPVIAGFSAERPAAAWV